MSEQQQQLLERATAKYGAIHPCSGRSQWQECFTQHKGQVIFWFNTCDESTHIEKGN